MDTAARCGAGFSGGADGATHSLVHRKCGWPPTSGSFPLSQRMIEPGGPSPGSVALMRTIRGCSEGAFSSGARRDLRLMHQSSKSP